ncbi:RDD family protein [Altererythrobacter aquiaggeris]|uniref:RDD family protein n=1 Tax=Aestuarierythrobacter aquiaggeris TaxID=1898396 RepID=UPI00301598A1
MSRAANWRDGAAKRARTLVTPEGVAVPVTLATIGSRAGALLIDFVIINAAVLLAALLLLWTGISVFGASGETSGPIELIIVFWMIFTFVVYNFYFVFFEMGPRGATPGKRLTGIRVAAHGTRRLTAEAIVARNLLRQIELFMPLLFIMGAPSGEGGAAGWAAGGWFAIFLLFPVFNRDNLRAGDLIAGTWVIEAPRPILAEAMFAKRAVSAACPSIVTAADYVFDEADLSVYGEYELQTLERILREGRAEAIEAVHDAICRKLGWNSGNGDERAFLEAFYARLRAKLEQDMRFGKRKADKFT